MRAWCVPGALLIASACATTEPHGDPADGAPHAPDARAPVDAAALAPDGPMSMPDAATFDAPVSMPADAATGDGGAGGDAGSTGDAGGCPATPTGLAGCPSCGTFCDSPWPVTWTPVPGATHYIVSYMCFGPAVAYTSGDASVDLCVEVGMCADDTCAFGAGPVTVRACNATCCSAAVTAPDTPIACGGGVCC